MLGSKILVAYDGSELADKALKAGLDLMEVNPGSRMDVVFVEEVSLNPTGAEVVDETLQRQNDKIFHDLQVKVKGTEPITLQRLRGQGASYVLLRFAEDRGSDLIILGNRGLTGVREMLGSVSHSVVQHALVPVLIVK